MMTFVIRKIRGVNRYFIDGKEVSKAVFDAEGDKARGDKSLPEGISKKTGGKKRHEKRGYPIKSYALAVTRKNIAAAQAQDAKMGVPTEYTKGGRPILRDAAHRKAYLKAHQMHDRNSFYGY